MPAFDGQRSPATLFVRYWRLAATWTASQRAAASRPTPAFARQCQEALRGDDGEDAHDAVAALVGPVDGPADLAVRRRVLTAMAEIDRAFHDVHPRALAAVLPGGGVASAPEWLRDAREGRGESGCYARIDGESLIPRGPLLRSPRRAGASSGDLLPDRFAALTVAPAALNHDGRDVAVHMPVIQIEVVDGVLASRDPGAERVGFAPVATEAAHVEVSSVSQGGTVFAHYRPGAGFDAASAAMRAVEGLARVDVIVMPELALSEAHVDSLCSALGVHAGDRARLIVSGSNLTTELHEGLPFNESRVLNGNGKVLWRQRKLWTAGVSRERAAELGLTVPDGQSLVLEATACGGTIVVGDVEGFGRCVVLICQDLTMPALAAEVASRFQPDWVFVPILDQFIDEGRWAHSQAYTLSGLSQARFVAVTSVALAPAYDAAYPRGIGFALGPKEPEEGADARRAFALVPRPAPGSDMWGEVAWRDGAWETTSVRGGGKAV